MEKQFYTQQEIVKRHSWLTMPMLKRLIRFRKRNGFASVVCEVSPRVLLIDENALEEWVSRHRGEGEGK